MKDVLKYDLEKYWKSGGSVECASQINEVVNRHFDSNGCYKIYTDNTQNVGLEG